MLHDINRINLVLRNYVFELQEIGQLKELFG